MNINFFEQKGRVRKFTISGPKGLIQIGITYTNRSDGVREYQVEKINTGTGWTEKCPDMEAILLKHIGEKYTGYRKDWLKTTYDSIENSSPSQSPSTTKKIRVVKRTQPLEWDEDLEGHTTQSYRKDQVRLRQTLLNGRSKAPCIICGSVFPEEFLWAAHLKKRSACTEKEKRDHANVAKLMCKFGCDDLYERGYIGVQDGKIRVLRQSDSTIVKQRLLSLNNRTCAA